MAQTWHEEYYRRMLRDVALEAEKLVRDKGSYALLDGWLPWFADRHPEAYRKFSAAVERIQDLWGRSDPASMDAFRQSCRNERDATILAIGQWLQREIPSPRGGEGEAEEEDREAGPSSVIGMTIRWTETGSIDDKAAALEKYGCRERNR